MSHIDDRSADRTLAELLVQSSVDGLSAIDRDCRYTVWNRAMERFAGKRADEVIGKRVFDVFPFLRDHGLDLAIERAFAGETVTTDAVPYDLPDGARLYYDRLYLPLRADDGQVVGMLGIVRDVTARRKAEDALRANEEKLRVAVDAAGVGLWSWDLQTQEVRWEDPLFGIFGLPVGQAPAGRGKYVDLVHPDDRAHCSASITRGVAAGRWEDEYRILRADGAVRWVMVKASVVHGMVHGAVIDVTERHQRDEQMRQAQKLEAVGQLTAGIAHNFNNMLMAMLPNLERAARTATPDVAPLLRDAEQAAQRAARLVRQLMTYAGRNVPTARSVESVAGLVERTVAFCRTTFDQRIAFDVRYDRATRARVDASQIEQALLNALINARDATAECQTPRVTVSVELVPSGAPELEGRAVDHVRVRIGDNGMGMDAATSSRIFEPFFTTKAVGKGTGLGLATSRAIVAEHGGFVTCVSARGNGATFSFYLPHEPGPVDAARSVPTSTSVRGNETVLVVDDEAPIRDIVGSMLTEAGFVTKLAASGEEAAQVLSDPRVAAEVRLVLLDVSMPGMSGRELRNLIRARAPRAPGARVVYFSGYAYEAPDAGDAVLEKPASREQLLATIRGALDR